MAHLGKRQRVIELQDDDPEDDSCHTRAAPDAALLSTFESMPPEQQEILRKAASLLNLPVTALLRAQEQPSTTASSTAPAKTIPAEAQATASSRDHGHGHVVDRRDSNSLPPHSSDTSSGGSGPFSGFGSYNYENMVPWLSSDASSYREEYRGHLEYRDRELNGFVPVGRSAPPHQLQPEAARHSTVDAPPVPEQPALALDPESAALSALVSITSSDVPNSDAHDDAHDDMADSSDNTATVPGTATPSESSASWTQMVSDAESPAYMTSGSADGEGASGQMIFVPVNPLEPSSSLVRRKRGPFENEQLRRDTGITRQIKACIRCRLQRTRCVMDDGNPSGTCLTCRNVGMAQKVYNLPCLRYRLTECTEFRIGKPPGMQWSARWPVMKLKDITKWASNEIRSITVKSDVSPMPFDLKVRRFIPIPQDSLHRAWMDGNSKKFFETTPYAISDMRSAMNNMRLYIERNIFDCIDYFLANADELVRMTFWYAREYMAKRTDSEDEARLLANYMKLWVAARRTQAMEHIVSQDTLHMTAESADKSYPFPGKVPLPPVMIQQLDIILTVGVLLPLQKRVLDDMQRLVLSNNPRTWMTMYLTTFMSLQSCASLSAENYRNARRQGFRRRYSFPAFIQERHNSANVFLSHYHYRTAQSNPFKLDWKRRHATPYAHMATEDVIFIEKTKGLLAEKSRADTIRMVRETELYENDLYFVSQMFDDNWQPHDSKIDFDGGTIYGGPVKKYYGDDETEW